MSKKRKATDLETCRLCLRKVDKVNLKNIFGDGFQKLSDTIFENTSIFVSPDDNLPQKICINCEALLNIVAEFKTTCLTANQILVDGKNVFQEAKDWLCDDNTKNLRLTEKLITKYKKEMEDFYSIAAQEIKIEQEEVFEVSVKQELSEPEMSTMEEQEHKKLKEPELIGKQQKAKKSPIVPCDICGMLVENKYHSNVHNDIRPFICSKEGCKKAFHSPDALKAHVKESHSNKFKEICTICGKRCKTESYLKDHMAVYHEDINPEPCTICSKLFSNKKAVAEHMMSHSHQEKKLQCEICQKIFRVAKNMKRHMRTHTNEKPYPCDQCNMKFGYNSSLKAHKEKIHKEKST